MTLPRPQIPNFSQTSRIVDGKAAFCRHCNGDNACRCQGSDSCSLCIFIYLRSDCRATASGERRAYIRIHVKIYIYIYTHRYMHIYIYMHIPICVYIITIISSICICVYIHPRAQAAAGPGSRRVCRGRGH